MNSFRKFATLFLFFFSILGIAKTGTAKSNLTDDYNSLFLLVTILSVIVLVLVLVLWGLFIFKYREGNQEVERTPLSHSTSKKLEVGWTVVATAIVILLMIMSYPVLINAIDNPEDSLTGESVEIVAEGTPNWDWIFYDPNGTLLAQPDAQGYTTITLNVDQPYKFIYWNRGNVIHSFFVPELNIKMDVFPGQNNTLTFQIEDTGQYDLFCAEFCGGGHSEMRGTINVVETGGYVG